MLGAMMLTTLALTATPASAQIEVLSEPGGDDCGEVTIDVHAVSGGCNAEFEGNILLYAHTPGEFLYMGCEAHFNARIGGDGSGYVSAASFFSIPSYGPCLRAPCDEPDFTMLPWEIDISEVAPGDEVAEVRFCIRPVFPASGSNQVCVLHLPLTDNGGHSYEIGDDSHAFCEGGSPQNSVKAHFVTEEPEGEKVEIIH